MPAKSNKNFWTEIKYRVQQKDTEVKIMYHYEWSDICMSVLVIIFTLLIGIIFGVEYIRVLLQGEVLNGYFVLFSFLYFSLMYVFLPLIFEVAGAIIKKLSVLKIDPYTLQTYVPFLSTKLCKIEDISSISILKKDNWLFLDSRIKNDVPYYTLQVHLKDGSTLVLPFMDTDANRIHQLKAFILSPQNFPPIEEDRWFKEDYGVKEVDDKAIKIFKKWRPKGLIKSFYFSIWDFRGLVLAFILIHLLLREYNAYIALVIPLFMVIIKSIHAYEVYHYYRSKTTLLNERGITIKVAEHLHKKAVFIKKEEIESILVEKISHNKFSIKVIGVDGRLEFLPFYVVDQYNIDALHKKMMDVCC